MNTQFTKFGIVIFAIILWLAAQSGSAEIKTLINRFLMVLLASMIFLNWNKISPIFFQKGTVKQTIKNTDQTTVNKDGTAKPMR